METENPLVVDAACGAELSGVQRARIILGGDKGSNYFDFQSWTQSID